MADRDADALEAQVLEIQELGLTHQQALAADRTKPNQAPTGRLFRFIRRLAAGNQRSPPRTVTKAEEREERRRRVISGTVVIGGVIRLIRAAIGVMPVMPGVTPCREVGRFLLRGLRRRRDGAFDRSWAGEHQRQRQDGRADPFRHQ